MKRLIYTLTLSAAMLAPSQLIMAKSDNDNRPDEKRCEAQCEVKKEVCEKLPDNNAVQKCKADVEQQCKQVCKEAEDHHDRDHR